MSQQYIAKELIHLTKTYKKLSDILSERELLGGDDEGNIEASRMGITEYISNYREDISQNKNVTVNKACLSDIPECQMAIHKAKYGDYGIAFDKDFIIRKGGIPVHYVPCKAAINSRWANEGETRDSFFNRMTKELYRYFDSLIVERSNDKEKREKFKRLQEFVEIHIKPYYKFFDHTLPDGHKDNYYFEREWFVVKSVKFQLSDIKKVLLPEEDEPKFKENFPNYGGPVVTSKVRCYKFWRLD